MMRISLAPSDLEAFLSVVETGSFSRSAKILGLSQPAVSARIAHLEQVLGVPLFNRTTRRVSSTEAGERLRIRVEHTMQELRDLLVQFDDEAHLRRGRISIGASATISAEFLAGAITRFHHRSPQVEITLYDDFYGRALDRLLKGEVDLAVLPLEPGDDVFRFEKLFSDPLLLVVSQSHRLAGRKEVSLQDLSGENFVTNPPTSASWDAFVGDGEGRSRATGPTLRTRNPFATLAVIKAGFGIGFVPQLLAETLNLQGVALLRMAEADISRDVGIATLKGRAIYPAATAFIETLHKAAADRSLKS